LIANQGGFFVFTPVVEVSLHYGACGFSMFCLLVIPDPERMRGETPPHRRIPHPVRIRAHEAHYLNKITLFVERAALVTI